MIFERDHYVSFANCGLPYYIGGEIEERDQAFEQMAARHGYYRKTDSPTQILEKIVR